MEFPENFSELSIAELTALAEQARAELSKFFELEAPTVAQATDAESLGANLQKVNGELAERNAQAERLAALRELTVAPTEAATEEPVEETPAEVPVEDAPVEAAADEQTEDEQTEDAPAETPATVEAAAKPDTAALAGRRPARAPAQDRPRAEILAGTDVPGINTGGTIRDMEHLAQLAIDKARSFPTPNGSGEGEDLRRFSLAQIRRPYPTELRIDPGRMSSDEMLAVLNRAVDQTRLPGGNLVASAGWCAPSEVAYDLCEGESMDGLLSAPEVELTRGGLKYTMGPDWAAITGNGEFHMTEAQAIAGSYTKPSFEIPCPTFTEARLDAYGIFVKVPLLLEAAYPELVARWMRGINTSHAHVMNSAKITAIQTALGAAETFPNMDMGSAAISLLDIITLVAERERTKRMWAFSTQLEMVLPSWVRGAIRSDIANRTGRNSLSVPDGEIDALFRERGYAVQFVYDWQGLATDAAAYPNTFDVLIYKAGTFVVGTKDVITLQSVYDAASLAANVYTGIFTEEGFNVMRMCPGGVRATVPVCIAGRAGAADVVACGIVGV